MTRFFSPTFKFFFIISLALLSCESRRAETSRIDLSGEWALAIDSLDVGGDERWFEKELSEKVSLPGSLTSNGKGDEITVNTPWMGSIFDSSWFRDAKYERYRQPGNIKVPFWLQPDKCYTGAAWYQKKVTIPSSWDGRHIEMFIERSHWESTVWVDADSVGMENSLGTPHVFDLTKYLRPGTHRITIRVDNRIKDFHVGQNSHSISDHTQTNWNGMIGQLYLEANAATYIDDMQLFPDIDGKKVTVALAIRHMGESAFTSVELTARGTGQDGQELPSLKIQVDLKPGDNSFRFDYLMGEDFLLWDEFHPDLYEMTARLNNTDGSSDDEVSTFGMREFSAKGRQLTVNGSPVFMRGTLECAIFPETGYPSTDEKEWTRIFEVCRSYGLNHMRFHSWTPPEAAFDAADKIGFYLQVECSSWANQGSQIGSGWPLDEYIYSESERVVKTFGNHPSFCFMAYGNEPAGPHHVEYLTGFVEYWKKKDERRLYTTGAGWPLVPENDFNNTPAPRIQHWNEGINSIINSEPPRFDYDWTSVIQPYSQPTISHEIGQWCVYPDFKEINRYKGVLKAKNFEIFRETLQQNGMGHLADSFLLASGKLQRLCYKADIEAALRTSGFGGFQLLDLHDFPGQGTALVGVLNPFWEEKGYVSAKEFSQFCNATVPLARLPKMVFTNNENLKAHIEVAHFGALPLQSVAALWAIKDNAGNVIVGGTLPARDIPIGNTVLGEVDQSLDAVKTPRQLVLEVSVGEYKNSWDIFVYPSTSPEITGVHVTQLFDRKAKDVLAAGGRVLLTPQKGTISPENGGDIAVGFSSIFWNTAWTNGQAPHTLGVLCNPKHAALENFPTSYHSNWQWWDAMSHSNAIRLDKLPGKIEPLVRIIDDWVTARPLALILECRVGNGSLIIAGVDLLTDTNGRPAARQLLFSLKKYMSGRQFDPEARLALEDVEALFQ